MKRIFIILPIVLMLNIGMAQTIGVSLAQIKSPPQYLFLKKDKFTSYKATNVDNPQVDSKKPRVIPSIFSVETLPFFCKIEYKMGLNKKLPLKFRLGDVQYVDELEGKKH